MKTLFEKKLWVTVSDEVWEKLDDDQILEICDNINLVVEEALDQVANAINELAVAEEIDLNLLDD